MPRAQGARAQLALAFEDTYGTAPAASNYWRMPFASSTLGAERPLLDSELLGYGRDPLPPVPDVETVDGDVVIPIDLRCWGIWLKAAFGDPDTTEDTGVFTHVFESGEWDLPSFAVEVGMPEVPHYSLLSGAMVNQLSWQMQRSGLLTATASVIAQGENPASSSSAGALNDHQIQRFGQFNGAVERNGTPLGNIVSAQITYNNNLDRIETIRADGKIDGADPSIAALSGTIDVRFADQTLLNQAVDGTASALKFSFSRGADEEFELVAHAVYLPKPRLPIQGPQGVQASFAWQAALDSQTGRMCTATLVNDVEDYDNGTV